MKKIIAMIMLVIICATVLVGCGNQSIGFGNYTFDKVHVDTYNYNGCFTIVNWHDNETGIEVKTKEAGSLYLSEGMYMLIEDDCPFCVER